MPRTVNKNKQHVEAEILKMLFDGKTFIDIKEQNKAVWGLSRNTLDRWYQEFKKKYDGKKREANEELYNDVKQKEKDILEELGFGKLDALKILREITESKIEGTANRILALKTMSDMCGWNAPKKIAETDENGKSITRENGITTLKVIFEDD